MSFNFYDSYYGSYVGIDISGSIGNKFTFYSVSGKQHKRRWILPPDPQTPAQLNLRDLFRKAVASWQTLTNQQKEFYEKLRPRHKIMSGYNFFISSYMKHYI